MRLSDLKAGSNTKQTLLLPVASHYPIEMTVICGSCPGKTLVVTAGVHGCEYVGIETLNRLKKELDPIDLSGRIILLPLVNPEGFYMGSKQIIPADGQNLNRTFPGDPEGTFSSRLAKLLEELKKEKDSFKGLGINYEEKAFYDILKAVAKEHEFEYPEDKMIELSKRIKTVVDNKAKYTDWSTRDDIKANLQVDLILLLDEFGYPPVTIDDVYKEVLEQAENFKKYAN